MVIYLAAPIKMGGGMAEARSASASPGQPEYYQECAIEVLRSFPVNVADDAPDPVMAERDHLVRHNLRAEAKAVRWFGFDNRSERQPLLKV